MSISESLNEVCIATGCHVKDKEDALRNIASLAGNNPALKNISEDQIFQYFFDRENLGSTALGEKIAIPHCVIDGISDFVVGIMTIPEGVDFNALDGNPTKLLVFIVTPYRRKNQHVRYLANVSSVLMNPVAINEILAEKDPAAVKKLFLKYENPQ